MKIIYSIIAIILPICVNSQTYIGNLFASRACSIAFIKNHEVGVVMDFGEGMEFPENAIPGITAPDWSYQEFDINKGDTVFRCQWSRINNDCALIKISTKYKSIFKISLLDKTWDAFNTVFHDINDGIQGTCITSDGRFINWYMHTNSHILSKSTFYTSNAQLVFEIDKDKPAYILAGFTNDKLNGNLDNIIEDSRLAYMNKKSIASGSFGDFLGAVADNLNNTRVYSNWDKRISHTVSRGWWAKDANYVPYFCWDSFFNALLASNEDPLQAWETIRAVMTFQTPEGMIANFSHWRVFSGFISLDRPQPPVGAMCTWKVYQASGDIVSLKEIYPKLKKWNEWWHKFSDNNNNFLLEWYSANSNYKDAQYATGWDDTPHFDGVKMAKNSMACDAVDLSSLWAADCKYLSKIADVIGEKEDAITFKHKQEKMNEAINKVLWNEKEGMYCSRMWDIETGNSTEFLTRYTPANFYPLISEAVTDKKWDIIKNKLFDKRNFWGEWIIPTLPYNDELYKEQNYWKGKVWGPVNYLIWQGLKNYANDNYCYEFVSKSNDLFMRNWVNDRTCGENYNSINGKTSSDPHYTWGALLPRITLESLVEIDENLKPKINTNITRVGRLNIVMKNVLIGGCLYDITLNSSEYKIRLK